MRMSELLQIQRVLKNYLLDEKIAVPAPLIVESARVSREVRLHIYANAYRARMVEALSVDFSGLHAYLGDDAFAELIHAYIEQHPSHYFSLRNVGGELPDFLKITHPYAEHIELHELAMFEWALCHAFDAADAICASASYFSTLPPQQWPEITLQFSPSLKMLSMRSNAPAIWRSLTDEQTPPVVEIAACEQSWLVWRRDLKIMFRTLDTIEKIALEKFAEGAVFADVCESLAEVLPESEVPQRAVTILQQWLTDQLIVSS